jgi:hypothetical protein
LFKRFAIALAVVGLMTTGVTTASTSATPTATPSPVPKPRGGEIAFVKGIQADLNARFATIADAEKAGYFRYTPEDHTGSISYANLQWSSSDPKHPSQLWYDVNGNLLGADFSVLQSASPTAPNLWGVEASRWNKFGAHVHWVIKGADGKETYGATSIKRFTAAGGSLDNPDAATVVKLGKAARAADVTHVFVFPAIWDLTVWVKDNPNGAFADMNPNVIPSANAPKSDD